MEHEERQKNVLELICRCDAAAEAFSAYAKAHMEYHSAAARRRSVATLLSLNSSFAASTYCVRQSFSAFLTYLSGLVAKYENEALGRFLAVIKLEVDKWDKTNLLSKYAAEWMTAFSDRLQKLELLRNKLNCSPKRQRQIDKIAAQPFPEHLHTVSAVSEVKDNQRLPCS